MPKYTRQDRQHALTALAANDGHIAQTSRETGIPSSTLRDWRDAAQPDDTPPDDTDFNTRAESAIEDALLAVLTHIQQGSEDAALNHQVSAFNGLFDRLLKLRGELDTAAPHALEIRYVDAAGQHHTRPVWLQTDDADDETAHDQPA